MLLFCSQMLPARAQENAAAAAATREAAEAEEEIQLLSLERQLPFRRVSPRLAQRWRQQQQQQDAIQVDQDVALEVDGGGGAEPGHADEADEQGPRQRQQQPAPKIETTIEHCVRVKRTCILMYISLLTLLITCIGPILQMLQLVNMESVLAKVRNFLNLDLNETVHVVHTFVNDSVVRVFNDLQQQQQEDEENEHLLE